MGAAFTLLATLETLGPCYKCGVEFAAPASYVRKRHEDKQEFFCPNGHGQVFAKSSLAELKAQLEAEKRSTEFQRNQRHLAEKQLIAQKAQTTKARNQLERVGNGVCPCCNRSFQNLMRHMSTKHPDFKKQEPA